VSDRGWNALFAVAAAAYLVGGTALLGEAMNAGSDAVWPLVTGAEVLLLVAAVASPGWWVLVLPLATFVPVAIWGTSRCEPGFLDLCGLVWFAAAFVTVLGLVVAAIGTWIGHLARKPESALPRRP
jgi:hypothetical protein